MDEFPSNLPSTFMLLYCSGHSVHFPLTNLNLIGRSPIYFIHYFPGGGNFFYSVLHFCVSSCLSCWLSFRILTLVGPNLLPSCSDVLQWRY